MASPNLIGALGTVGFGLNPGVADAAATINPRQFCHQDTGFTTQAKFLGSYTLPKIDLLVSASFQSLPGPVIAAFYTATSAQVSGSLGRSLSGNAANVTADIIPPASMFGDRLNQFDFRVGKILRYGRTKMAVNLDVFNALNLSPITSVNNAYATWLRPNSILTVRFAKISVQLDI